MLGSGARDGSREPPREDARCSRPVGRVSLTVAGAFGRRFPEMRTTLKRGVGRGADLNDGERACGLPARVGQLGRPLPPAADKADRARAVLPDPARDAADVVAVGLAVAGGGDLWFHQTVQDLHATGGRDRSPEAARRHPAGPCGDRARDRLRPAGGQEFSDVSRSDTVMLIRADPATKTISLLSFPRDLGVPIYCPKSGNVRSACRPDQPGLRRLRRDRDARHRQAPDRPPDQLPDHGQLPRLQGDRRQARRGLDGRRPPLLPRQQRLGGPELREHQPPARLPAADRRSRRSTSSATATPTTTTTGSRASRSSSGRSSSSSRATSTFDQAAVDRRRS